MAVDLRCFVPRPGNLKGAVVCRTGDERIGLTIEFRGFPIVGEFVG